METVGGPDAKKARWSPTSFGAANGANGLAANASASANRDAFAITSGDLANQQYWRIIVRLTNHGSGTNQALWADRGYANPRAAACNTFRAPQDEVT